MVSAKISVYFGYRLQNLKEYESGRFRVKSWVAVGGLHKSNNTPAPPTINDYILRD